MTSASECATRAGSQAMSIVEDLAEESDLSEWEEALFAESDEDRYMVSAQLAYCDR